MFSMKLVFICLLVGLVYYTEGRVGGGYLEPVSKDHHEVKSLSAWAAVKLHGKFVDVIDAQRQIVAGWLYHLDIHVVKHNQMMKCNVKVWIRHWLNKIKLVGAHCEPVKQ